MARYAKKSTIEELTEKLNAFLEDHELPEKDFKITFDDENYFTPEDEESFGDEYDETSGTTGYYQVGDFAVGLFAAGGDWEKPVFYAAYISDKDKIRVYIPTKGNCFNPWTKTAIGSERDCDDETWCKMPKEFRDEDDFTDAYFDWADNLKYDTNAMLEDIKERIQVKESN